MDDQAFRFTGFNSLVASSRSREAREQLSKLELGFIDAADFDTDFAMEGFLHPFIYRAARIPSVVWFLEFIGASGAADPIQQAFLTLKQELGEPTEGSFGDEVSRVLDESSEYEQRFEAWEDEYRRASNWAELFEAVLKSKNIDPVAFWKR